MTSQIDPSFITAAPVSKSMMRTQLGIARDEITALQELCTSLEAQIAVCCGDGVIITIDDGVLVVV